MIGLSNETLGLAYSLLTAVFWAVAVILFKKSGATMGPLTLNTFKNVIGLVLLGATGLVIGFEPGPASTRDVVWLMLSGALGIGLADTLLFYGLNQIGATRQAIVDTIYSPLVVLFSFAFLGEVLSLRDALGGALILSAVLLAIMPAGRGLPVEQPRMTRGLLASALSMVFMALAIVLVKPIIEANDVLFCTTLRLLGGTLSLSLFALSSRDNRRELALAFIPARSWRYAIPGAVTGTYFSLLLWIGSFKYAPAGVAALLNQTSTIFIVLLATFVLGERLSTRVGIAVLLATLGSVLVLL